VGLAQLARSYYVPTIPTIIAAQPGPAS
jgi:hypothetical protein